MKKLFFIFIAANLLNCLNAQDSELFVETTKVEKNIYKICAHWSGSSINIYAFTGIDGTLLIDSGMDLTADLVRQELQKLGIDNIKYIINTHNDGDHTWGNSIVANGAVIISHENCRKRLLDDVRMKKDGIPHVTFEENMSLYFNDEELILRYIPGHTNNDIYIEFKKAKLLFMGDMMFESNFPAVHPSGDVYKMIDNLKKIRKLYPPQTIIFSGHGKLTHISRIDAYVDMIEQTKTTVVNAINSGMGLTEAIESKILQKWTSWNSNERYLNRWLEMLYKKTNEGMEKSAAYNLGKLIDQNGCNKAKEEFEQLISNGEYFITERDINDLGYAYLFDKKFDEALLVFIINTELYPESANTYDSLGEIYMNIGKYKLAIANYEKSIELNPNNTYAEKMITKIKTQLMK